jgi:hypothetical protein
MINLRCKNPEPRMSALGQKRTFTHLRLMSALLPIADIIESDQKCPLGELRRGQYAII